MVVPAQALQEYWNNHATITQNLQQLVKDTGKLADRFGSTPGGQEIQDRLAGMAHQVSSMAAELADAANPDVLHESVSFWEVLSENALVVGVPRHSAIPIGEARLQAAVAPGFEDAKKAANRLGDFLVWADFLFGLAKLSPLRSDDQPFCVVFVTDDRKPDWMSNGAPHPTLLNDVMRLTDGTLQILSVKELLSEVDQRSRYG
jgi:hypothetical protein